jgi:hypothetical protein
LRDQAALGGPSTVQIHLSCALRDRAAGERSGFIRPAHWSGSTSEIAPAATFAAA